MIDHDGLLAEVLESGGKSRPLREYGLDGITLWRYLVDYREGEPVPVWFTMLMMEPGADLGLEEDDDGEG